MKCRWKFCKLGGEVDKENAIERRKGFYYHEQCNKELDQYNKIKDLYNKYYNKNENWNIINRTLVLWIEKYGVEFVLFCLCKAIRNKIYLRRFQSLYYILTDKKWIDEYEKYKENEYDKEKLYGEFVILRESQYFDLEKKLGQKQLHYYINRINSYMKVSGKTYNSYYDTILLWKERDDENKPINTGLFIHDS